MYLLSLPGSCEPLWEPFDHWSLGHRSHLVERHNLGHPQDVFTFGKIGHDLGNKVQQIIAISGNSDQICQYIYRVDCYEHFGFGEVLKCGTLVNLENVAE